MTAGHRDETGSSAAGGERAHRWLLIAVAAGVFVAADDQTSIVTVLPAILQDIRLPVDDFYRSSWVVNSYLLGYLVALPLLGRVADVYGRARVFAAALGVFALGSALVALAPGFGFIVVARGVQAVGGGGVVPVAMAIVVGELPAHRRALGLGAIAAASEGGALLGPLWGGAITEWFGWRWVFWVNLPMVLPMLVTVWRLGGHERRRGAIDWSGAALLGALLALLTFALVDDPNARRPLAATLAMLAGVAAFGAAFWWRERRAAEPMVRLALFRSLPIAAANLANVLVGAGLIVVLIGVPLFVNLVLVEPPLDGGLTLMRLTVAVPVGAIAGGWLAGRVGLRMPAVAGMLLAAAGFAGLQAWGDPLSEALRTVPQLVGGFGFGLVIAPLATAALQRVGEDERGVAAAWLTLSRVTGMLVGAALLTSTGLGRFYARAGTVPFDSPEFQRLVADAQITTFREVFIAAAIVMLVAAAVACFVGRGERSAEVEWRGAG
ncbi:MAG: MFS transporter [Chloroflexi bacterium]|nr:MFS transporter [Chloroflexota bacterium]